MSSINAYCPNLYDHGETVDQMAKLKGSIMKKTLATLALFIAGFFLVLGTQPDTVFSAPYDAESDEIPTAYICGLVRSAKALDSNVAELSIEVYAHDKEGMFLSTRAVGTFYSNINEDSCSRQAYPHANVCFDFSERNGSLWIRNCVAPD